MAQRKSPSAGKPAQKKGTSRPAGKPAGGSSATARAASGKGSSSGNKNGSKPASVIRSTPARPPAKRTKPGKSIVNQRQRPWGLIATTIAVVLFAAGVIIAVIATHKSSSTSANPTTVDASDPYRQPELPAAKQIQGVTYRVEGNHFHVGTVVNYDSTPPVGGNHSPYWANCNGVVYDHQLANENAVHMLEHGAVWITYNPKTLPAADLTKLESYVKGQDRMALTPFAGLKTPISLQAWGYQLFVDSASDPRIAQFIATLRYNPKTTPENASCTDPVWSAALAARSTPGHPVNGT